MKTNLHVGLLVILLALAGLSYSRSFFISTPSWQPESLAYAQSSDNRSGLILTDARGEYPLGLYLDILEDSTTQLTIEDVTSPKYASQFVPSREEIPNFGFTHSAYWVRLRLRNEASQINEWRLELGLPEMNYIDLYAPAADEPDFVVKRAGLFLPFSGREVSHHHFVFKLPLTFQTEQTIYLRFETGAAMLLPLTLWSPEAFTRKYLAEQFTGGLIYGIMLIIIGYNLYLFVALRDKNYAYLVLTVTTRLLFFAVLQDGRASQYLWPDHGYWNRFIIPPLFSLLFLFFLIFTRSFLKIKKYTPRLQPVLTLLLAGVGLLFILMPFVSYGFFIRLVAPYYIIFSLTIMVAGVVVWRRGYQPARFFLLAEIIPTLITIYEVLVRLGLLPAAAFINAPLGMVSWAFFWSLALADRIHLLKAETEQANRQSQASERRLAQFMEVIPVGITVLNALTQTYQYTNRRARQLFSQPYQPIATQPTTTELAKAFPFYQTGIEQPYPPENLPSLLALRQGKQIVMDNLEFEQADGRRIALEIWSSPVFDEQRQVQHVITAFQDITARKQLEQRLLSIYTLGQELTLLHEETAIVRRVLDTALPVLRAEASGYALVDQTADELVYWFQKTDNPAVQFAMRLPLTGPQGLGVRVLHSGQPLNIPDTSRESGYVAGPGDWVGLSALYAPLKMGGQIGGVLIAESLELNHFTPADQLLFQTLADQAAVAIENARLFQQSQNQTEKLEQRVAERTTELIEQTNNLELLHRVGRELVVSLDLEQVYAAAHQAVRELMPAEVFVISLLEAGEQMVEDVYLFDQQRWPNLRYPLGRGMTSRVILSGEALYLDDCDEATNETLGVELFGSPADTRSVLVVPLRLGHKIMGIISTQDYQPYAYTSSQKELFNTLANQVSVAIANAQLLAEIQQAREAAEAASRAKSTFLAQMNHELRTPMSIIIGYAELMRHSEQITHQPLPPLYNNYLDAILHNGQYLLALINNVLDLAKIEAGHKTLQESDFNLDHLLADVMAMFDLPAKTKHLQLAIDCPPDIPRYLQADGLKLRQILINLLSNAFKFTTQGGVVLRVRLKTEKQQGEISQPSVFNLHFSVEDTGPGIASTDLKYIFEPFTQAEAGQATRQGSGLGLTISRELVQLMGGEIKVTSPPAQPYFQPEVGNGPGTEFAFSLTMKRAEALAATAGPWLDQTAASSTLSEAKLGLLADAVLLPADLVAELSQAATRLDLNLALSLCQRVQPYSSVLAATLEEWIHQFQFEQILNLLGALSNQTDHKQLENSQNLPG